MSILTAMAILILIMVLAWNFVPFIREKMRGTSTIIEVILAGVTYYGGLIYDVIQEAQSAGYLPAGFEAYVPMFFFGWMIFKRVTTRTAVGEGDDQ